MKTRRILSLALAVLMFAVVFCEGALAEQPSVFISGSGTGTTAATGAVCSGIYYSHSYSNHRCTRCSAMEPGYTDAGTLGTNITWYITDAGVLTVSGKGSMLNFASGGQVQDSPWKYSNIKRAVIGSGITDIGRGAFFGCGSLRSVSIPETVTTIGKEAFLGCSLMSTTSIPSGVKFIGDYAFYGCSGLKTVYYNGTAFQWYDIYIGTMNECLRSCDMYCMPGVRFDANGGSGRMDDLFFKGTVNLPANSFTRSGYTFVGWNTEANGIGISYADCAAVYNISTVLYAQWKQNSYYYPPTPTSYSYSYGTTQQTLSVPMLTAAANGKDGITVRWNAVYGAERYKVLFRGEGESWKIAGDTSGTEFTVTGLPMNKNYWFTVCCADKNGNAMSSYDPYGLLAVYTGLTKTLKAPVLKSATNNETGVKVVWEAVSGAEKYRVFYKETSESDWHKVGDTTNTELTAEGLKSGTEYVFTVRCVTADGSTYMSPYDKAGLTKTYIAMPKLTKASVGAKGVNLEWNKVTGAGGYRIYYKISGESKWTSAGDTDDTSMTVTGLKSGKKYLFTVRCLNKAKTGCVATYDKTGTEVTYLNTPELEKVSNMKSGVKVTWNGVSGAKQYRVLYKASNDADWTNAGETEELSMTVTGLKSGKEYTFSVRCLNPNGSGYASWLDKKGLSIRFVAMPELERVYGSAAGVTAKWEAVSGVKKYMVLYRKSGDTEWISTEETTETSYTVKNLIAGTKYDFTVRGIGSDGSKSSYDRTGMSITYTDAPVLEKVKNTASGVNVSWNGVSGAKKYRVFYKTANDAEWTKAGDTDELKYTVKKLKSGTTYYFTVRGLTADGHYSGGYDKAGLSIYYIAAPALEGATAGSKGVKVTWNAVGGAEKYRVYYKLSGKDEWTEAGDTTETSFTVKNLKSGKKYDFTVRCVSADGTKNISAYSKTGISATAK